MVLLSRALIHTTEFVKCQAVDTYTDLYCFHFILVEFDFLFDLKESRHIDYFKYMNIVIVDIKGMLQLLFLFQIVI